MPSLPIVVLLVDDQQFVAMAVGQLLSAEPDIELHSCLSARDAIATANRIGPTVVLQDLVMPDGDGLSLVALFRANPATAAIPVIVLSGNDDAPTRARALAAGAADYLVKLPTRADLIACIRRHGSNQPAGSATLDPQVMATFRAAGSPDFTRRVIDQFTLEVESRVRSLRDAVAAGDRAVLTADAHSLKGSSMIMGALRLAALCVQLEEQLAVDTGRPIPSALMTSIEQESADVREALAAERLGDER